MSKPLNKSILNFASLEALFVVLNLEPHTQIDPKIETQTYSLDIQCNSDIYADLFGS